MLTEQKNVSGSVYVKVVVSGKSKVNSHYLDNGDAMYRLLSNQTTLPCIENLHQETFCRYESMGNFRKFEKFRKNYFVPILPCKKSKVKKNSEPNAKKMRIEFPKMDIISKVPSKQAKLQFQLSRNLKYRIQSNNLHFPSTSIITSKNKNVSSSISLDVVSSLYQAPLNLFVNLSLAYEEISFSNSTTPAAQTSSFSSKDFFSLTEAFSNSIS